MKTFIVAALLVAAVAGQSFDKDLVTSRKGMSLKNRFMSYPYQYGGEYSNMINSDYDLPSTYYGDDETYNQQVLQYDEIMVQPLFREYMSLPIFRQYWSYPMFQRYVCSHYFQQYWQLPAFQQFFVQPTLFYKYVYPIVTLFKHNTNSYTGGDWTWNKNTEIYQHQPEQQYYGNFVNQYNVPAVCRYNAVYCRALVQKMYNHLMYTTKMTQENMDVSNVDSDMYKYNPYVARMINPTYYNKEMYPTVYNKEMYPTTYNKEFYPSVYNKEMYPTVYNKEFYPTIYNKEMYPTVYNKEMYPTIYNKEMYPTIYNKEMYPTVYNKDFPTVQVPKTIYNNDLVYPRTANTIEGKAFEQKFLAPEQLIKA